MSSIDNFWAVIPAGGAGTRLWPLSRSSAPKFLHDLSGSGRTLLQETRDRLGPLVDDRVVVVTGEPHRDAVLAQLSELAPDAVVAEPAPRDSMAAIGLAAALLERRDPDAVMGSFAADHVVADPDAFRDAVRRAVAVAREDWLVTLGIEPTFPSAAFGYVHLGDPLPGLEGACVVRPTVLLDLLHEWHPDFADALRAIAADPSRLAELWPTLPKIALDHAVAEPAADAGRVAVVPSSFPWEDIGDFDALATLLSRGQDAAAPTVLGDGSTLLSVDSTGLVVPSSGRVVAVVGLDDVVVVDTPDALLVTTRARAQDVKQIVAELKESGRGQLT